MKNIQTSDGGEQNLHEVCRKIQDAYECIAFWKKNILMLPTHAAEKKIHKRDKKTNEELDEQFFT